jgi:hypothetical protein
VERSDAWRDSYDEWKLRSPYDKYPGEECDHVEADLDIVDGRFRCACGHSWRASGDELIPQAECEKYAQWGSPREPTAMVGEGHATDPVAGVPIPRTGPAQTEPLRLD